jgi:hypothetical protein
MSDITINKELEKRENNLKYIHTHNDWGKKPSRESKKKVIDGKKVLKETVLKPLVGSAVGAGAGAGFFHLFNVLGQLLFGATWAFEVAATATIAATVGAMVGPLVLAIGALGLAYYAVSALKNNKYYETILKPTKDIDAFFQALTYNFINTKEDFVYHGSYDFEESGVKEPRLYTFYRDPIKGKLKFTVINAGHESLFYVFNTDSKEPIFKWINEDGKPVVFYHRNGLIFIASTVKDHFILHEFGEKENWRGVRKILFATTLSSKIHTNKGSYYRQLSVKCPQKFFDKAFDEEANKIEIIMRTAVQAFQKAGKGAKDTQKLSNWKRFLKKQKRKNKVDKVKKKYSLPVYDPFPFATQIRRREHNLYKKLRY